MNKNVKKAALFIIAASMATGALAGCGIKKTSISTAYTEDGKTLIHLMTASKDVNPEAYEKDMARFAEFESFYETEFAGEKNAQGKTGVKVEPSFFEFNVKDFAAFAVGGQLPTYYHVPLTEAKGIMDAGYGKDITKWMEKYGYTNGIDEQIAANIKRDNDNDGEEEIYLLPFNVYTLGIAVNLDYLRQAGYVSEDGTPHQPETFEELAQMAQKIKEVTGKPGFVTTTMSNAGGWKFTPIAWAYGVDFMEQDENGDWKATFNTPECVAALQYVKDLKWKYDVLPEDILLDNAKERNMFGAGEAAMCIASGGTVDTFVGAGMSKDNLGYVAMPAGPKRHVTLIGGAYYVFNNNATDDQIEAAFRYLDWSGQGRTLTEDVKTKMQENVQKKLDENKLVGVLTSSPYTEKDPMRAYELKLNEEMANINLNQVKHYNDRGDIEWQQEEPVEAQALYAVLDNAIQAVLTDENADCAKLVEEAYKNFQTTLDTVNNA